MVFSKRLPQVPGWVETEVDGKPMYRNIETGEVTENPNIILADENLMEVLPDTTVTTDALMDWPGLYAGRIATGSMSITDVPEEYRLKTKEILDQYLTEEPYLSSFEGL